jgi:hypothetical protein
VVLFAGTNFHLAVLLPTANSWPEGRALIGAIALAVDDANAQAGQPDPVRAVRGGNVTSSWREADCEPSAALAALTHILDEGPVDAVIGPDCSVACESTAILTAGLDIPQISYSCSSIALSDKKTYPTVRLNHRCHGPRAPRILGSRLNILLRMPVFRSLFVRRRATQAGCQQCSGL